jgi:hypothetical protein
MQARPREARCRVYRPDRSYWTETTTQNAQDAIDFTWNFCIKYANLLNELQEFYFDFGKNAEESDDGMYIM